MPFTVPSIPGRAAGARATESLPLPPLGPTIQLLLLASLYCTQCRLSALHAGPEAKTIQALAAGVVDEFSTPTTYVPFDASAAMWLLLLACHGAVRLGR